MRDDKKSLLKKYLICLCVAMVILVVVFVIRGFFGDDIKQNIATLSDATFTVGILFLCFYGMLFISSEGGLLGISFVLVKVARAFIPMGRKDTETYAQYRERKLSKPQKKGDVCVLFTGLFFIVLSIIFIVVWYNT